jgi:tetratricopeptide (TPR) repeat protein
MPGVGTALEELLWATALTAASEADVESWIDTVQQLDEAEIDRLQQSTLAADNATILCDGVWLRDYRKIPEDRDWGRVEAQITKLRDLGRRRKISTLEAAAIRTLIMLKAEWQHDVDGAVTLAEASVTEFTRDEDAFLIVEVTGRQLFYNARSSESEQWLERAHSYPITNHALWRRNVLITLAEIRGKESPGDALGLVKEAVEVSRKWLEPERLAEVYAEEAIANWNLGDREGAFQSLSLAIHTLLPLNTGSVTWKQCFAGLFQMAFCYSSRACDLKLPTEVSEPTQGAFLGLDNFNISAVNGPQRVIIQARLSMFAEGIGATDEAGQWFDRALSLLEEIPEARAIRMHAGLGIAPALLAGDVVKAIRLGLMMADAEIKSALALEHVQQLPDTEKQAVLEMTARGATIQAPFAFFRFMTPIAAQLATAKLNGAPPEHLQQTMDQVSQALKDRPERQNILSALQTAILEGTDWESLHRVASTLVPQTNTLAAGMIYMIGAALHAPISVSFGLQVWLAQHVEKLFGDLPSIQSKIFYPFLKSYWTKAVDAQAYSFRTAQAYTQNAILDACSVDNPCLSARILLRRMAFCLYGSFPEQIARWLNSDDPNYPLQQRTSGSTALCEVTDFGKSSEQTDSSLARDPTNRAGIEQ